MNILNFIINFITTYWSDALVILVFCFMLWLMYFKLGKKKAVIRTLKRLIKEAEDWFTISGEGKSKKDFVLDEFYKRMPAIFRILIPEEFISKLIDDIVLEINEALDEKEKQLE